MIIATLCYQERHNVTNNAGALATADLHGWKIRDNEVREAKGRGPKVHQILTLVPIDGRYVDQCPTNLMTALMKVVEGQWGGIFALETRVGGS